MKTAPASSDDPYRAPSVQPIEHAGTRKLPYARFFAACIPCALATPAVVTMFLWSPALAFPGFVLMAALAVLCIVWVVRGYMSQPGVAHGVMRKVLMVTGMLAGMAVSLLLGSYATSALLAHYPMTTGVTLPQRE